MKRPRKLLLWLAGTVALCAVLALTGAWFYARGGGSLPSQLSFLAPSGASLLEPSDAREQVLRSLRLAGIERGVVGDTAGRAVVRVEVPGSSAGDFSAAWQVCLGALREAYPSADEYVVQLFASGAEPLSEMSWDGDTARGAKDAKSAREAARVRLLVDAGR